MIKRYNANDTPSTPEPEFYYMNKYARILEQIADKAQTVLDNIHNRVQDYDLDLSLFNLEEELDQIERNFKRTSPDLDDIIYFSSELKRTRTLVWEAQDALISSPIKRRSTTDQIFEELNQQRTTYFDNYYDNQTGHWLTVPKYSNKTLRFNNVSADTQASRWVKYN